MGPQWWPGRPKPAQLYSLGHLLPSSLTSLSLHFLLCNLGAIAAAWWVYGDYTRLSAELRVWYSVSARYLN